MDPATVTADDASDGDDDRADNDGPAADDPPLGSSKA